MAPWVLYLQGHPQLIQEAKRVTTHYCRAPACGSGIRDSIPPLLGTEQEHLQACLAHLCEFEANLIQMVLDQPWLHSETLS